MAKFEKKYTVDQVKAIFHNSGCVLLEDDYRDMLTPMKYVCQCGNQSVVRLFSFLKGTRCKQCGFKKISSSKKLSFDNVRLEYEKIGYQVLSTSYSDNKTPIEYICPAGHLGSTSYSNLKKGRRCKQCAIERNTGANNPNWNEDRDVVASNKKFRRMCRNMLKQCLSLTGKVKSKQTECLLGYKTSQLKDHIMSHPGMQSIGDGKWHIDHIFPIKAFLDYGVSDLRVINCLENLQPLSEIDNLKKNDSYSPEDFEEFLSKKGIQWK